MSYDDYMDSLVDEANRREDDEEARALIEYEILLDNKMFWTLRKLRLN